MYVDSFGKCDVLVIRRKPPDNEFEKGSRYPAEFVNRLSCSPDNEYVTGNFDCTRYPAIYAG